MMDGFEFSDVYITPFSELLDKPRGLSFHRGGPIWSNWEQQVEVRHRHRDTPVDDKPHLDPSDNIKTIDEPLLWCGPVTHHYGHQIADFLTRLPAYKEPDGLYCFAAHRSSSISKLSDTPRFFQDMLKWYNIPEDRIFIVSKPILAKKLFCLPQQERLTADGGIPPSQEYLDILTKNAAQNGLATESKNGIYFISRVAMSAKLAGYNNNPYCYDNHIRPQSQFYIPGTRVFKLEEGMNAIIEQISKEISTPLNYNGTKLLDRNKSSGFSSRDVPISTLALNHLNHFYSDDFSNFNYKKESGESV